MYIFIIKYIKFIKYVGNCHVLYGIFNQRHWVGLLSLNCMWRMTGKHAGNYLSAKEYVLKQMKNLPKKL